MRKRRIIAVLLVLAAVFACLIGGKYYLFRDKTEKIIALEIPPYQDEVILYEGETAYENFFEVIFENGFSYRDIDFISEDEDIATVKYSVTDRNRYVCFKVEGKSAGETEIYFSSDDKKIVSDRIKVTVLPKKENYTAQEVTEPDLTEESIFDDENNISSENPEKRDTASEKNETPVRGSTVYVAPTGKRYHYSKSCAGKNGRAVSLSEAKNSGKTPCKKCAGG